jgi:fucose permease
MKKNNSQKAQKEQYKAIGLVIGIAGGAALSLLFAVVLDSPGLIGVGAVLGVTFGKKIGEGLYQRNLEVPFE